MTAQRIGLVLAWLAGWCLLWRVPRLARAGTSDPTATTISVIVPARNEAATLPALLAGLLAQEHPPSEIIVVDDHSDDATVMVAAAAGARVLHPGDLPPSWTGKTWACSHGADVARGDLLVFLDADTEPGPQLLGRLAAEHSRRGGLVSVEPYHRMERATERLSGFFNVVSWMGIGAASVRRHTRITGAFGPCLVISRLDYVGIGGHAAVRGSVLEDVALARRCREAGLPVRCLGGRGSVQFRMYPDGVRHLIEGWSKNIAAGAGSTPLVRALLVFTWIAATITVGAGAVAGSVSLIGGGTGPSAMVWLLYAAWVLQVGVMLRGLGNFGIGSIVGFPVGVTVFVAIFVRSLFLTAVRREVVWKAARSRSVPRPTRARDLVGVAAVDGRARRGGVGRLGVQRRPLRAPPPDRAARARHVALADAAGRTRRGPVRTPPGEAVEGPAARGRVVLRRWLLEAPDGHPGSCVPRALRGGDPSRRADALARGGDPARVRALEPLVDGDRHGRLRVRSDVPCLVVQRYNRMRLYRVLERQKRSTRLT